MGSATCICGHEEDEHSLTGECQALDCVCAGYDALEDEETP